MSPVDVRDLGEPEAVVTYPLGASSQVRLAGTVVTRHVLQPGWSWKEHAQPEVGDSVSVSVAASDEIRSSRIVICLSRSRALRSARAQRW